MVTSRHNDEACARAGSTCARNGILHMSRCEDRPVWVFFHCYALYCIEEERCACRSSSIL